MYVYIYIYIYVCVRTHCPPCLTTRVCFLRWQSTRSEIWVTRGLKRRSGKRETGKRARKAKPTKQQN